MKITRSIFILLLLLMACVSAKAQKEDCSVTRYFVDLDAKISISKFSLAQFRDCVCPNITMTAPKGLITAGSKVIVTAKVNSRTSEDYSYHWFVTKGEIIDGQGTPSITISSTPAMAGQQLIATVVIDSSIYRNSDCATCKRNESEAVQFQSRKPKKKTTSRRIH